ncbi:type IV toxin-antitoxin system AbiEi family antitoxin domain-containing protein [Micromonospora sp. NPDC000442]|uniref:type IV toxin-antitoxin system AbiEi family antitoxin domain-containing protein n=1 Tax=Micromonospora sp. NPDC000442 TaxID=3364217 RepID=UPI003676CDA5
MDALTVVRRVAATQDSVITLAQARAAGLTVHEVHRLCRAGRWRVVARGVYLVDAELHDGVPRRARIRAAVASCGPNAAAVLATAAELYEIAGVRRSEEIHVSVPSVAARPTRPTDPRVTLHQLAIKPTELVAVAGIAATRPVRTVADLILRLTRYPAVCLVDSALNRGLIRDEDLPDIHRLIRGRRGAVAARGYLAEADCRAQSPLETRTRLRCVDGKVPPDVLQLEVRDHDGYLLGIGDLGWRRHRILAEADGKGSHSGPDPVFADRRRQNRLLNAGWAVLRFTWADTLHADYIPWTVRQAMQVAAPRDRS